MKSIRTVSGGPYEASGGGGLIQMCISELWDRLDATTQRWLLENPGCQILPRTISTKINIAAGETIECDRHGQIVLSKEDRDFIAAKA